MCVHRKLWYLSGILFSAKANSCSPPVRKSVSGISRCSGRSPWVLARSESPVWVDKSLISQLCVCVRRGKRGVCCSGLTAFLTFCSNDRFSQGLCKCSPSVSVFLGVGAGQNRLLYQDFNGGEWECKFSDLFNLYFSDKSIFLKLVVLFCHCQSLQSKINIAILKV